MSKPPVSGSDDGSEPPIQPETAAIEPVSHPYRLNPDTCVEYSPELVAELLAELRANANPRHPSAVDVSAPEPLSKPPVSGSGAGSEPPIQPETAAIVPIAHPETGRQAIRGHANAAKYAGCNEMAIRRAEKRLEPDRFGKVWFYPLEALDALKAELGAAKEAETADATTLDTLEDLFTQHAGLLEAPKSLSLEDIAEKVKVPPSFVRKQHARFLEMACRYHEKHGLEKPKLLTRKQLLEQHRAWEREEERASLAAHAKNLADLAKWEAEDAARSAKHKAECERQADRSAREYEKRKAASDLRLAQLQRPPAPAAPTLADHLFTALKSYGPKVLKSYSAK